VQVGALHALRKRKDCRRVAIIDFDVHHGNGTQVCQRSQGSPRLAMQTNEMNGW
jgi:acetoin utilization deacetylase AcuC-like enzyme